jgi:hypothetical protein
MAVSVAGGTGRFLARSGVGDAQLAHGVLQHHQGCRNVFFRRQMSGNVRAMCQRIAKYVVRMRAQRSSARSYAGRVRDRPAKDDDVCSCWAGIRRRCATAATMSVGETNGADYGNARCFWGGEIGVFWMTLGNTASGFARKRFASSGAFVRRIVVVVFVIAAGLGLVVGLESENRLGNTHTRSVAGGARGRRGRLRC